MKIFLLDLWQDLRAKRLAPVAAVLLVGLVAVPVLLAKPAEEPAPAPVTAAPSSTTDRNKLAALAEVKLGEEAVGKGSTLGTFDPDNPFSPPKGTLKKEPTAGAPSSSPDGASAGGLPAGSDGGSTGGTTDGGSGGGGTGGGGDTGGGTGGTPQTTVYKYVVDLRFTANGRTRRINGLEKLDMLPSDSSPLLIFMGVTPKGADAVFLVDSTLEAAGEGRCKPSGSECAFAYIGAGSEYVFTEKDSGDTYTIQIEEIRRVQVTNKAQSAKGAKARASVGPHRRFAMPLLADLVVVASDRLENSSTDNESR
jgi:hypothetical protein